jgi:hypothetical protein
MLRFSSDAEKMQIVASQVFDKSAQFAPCFTSGIFGADSSLILESSLKQGDFNGQGKMDGGYGRGGSRRIEGNSGGAFDADLLFAEWPSVGAGGRSSGMARDAQMKRSYPNKNRGKPLYSTWCSMRDRCNNPRDESYFRYGARGIKVCERWASFATFVADMGPKPTPAHTLERINNNGNYEPSNCRWATKQEQACNTRRTRLITIDGETAPMKVWMERLKVSSATLLHLHFGVPMPRRSEAKKEERRARSIKYGRDYRDRRHPDE